jgi:hypothetical protein
MSGPAHWQTIVEKFAFRKKQKYFKDRMVYRTKWSLESRSLAEDDQKQPTNAHEQIGFDNWLQVEKEDEEFLAQHPLPAKAISKSESKKYGLWSEFALCSSSSFTVSSSNSRKRQAESSADDIRSTAKLAKVESNINSEQQTNKPPIGVASSSIFSSSSALAIQPTNGDAVSTTEPIVTSRSSSDIASSSTCSSDSTRYQTINWKEEDGDFQLVVETNPGFDCVDASDNHHHQVVISVSSGQIEICFKPQK